MGGAGMIGDWVMPVSPFGGTGKLPIPSAQWERTTTVRTGHAKIFLILINFKIFKKFFYF